MDVAMRSRVACCADHETKPRVGQASSHRSTSHWSFVVVQSAITTAEHPRGGPVVSVPVSQTCRDLLELFAQVPDGRSDQGRDHPAAVVLALAAQLAAGDLGVDTVPAVWTPQRHMRPASCPPD